MGEIDKKPIESVQYAVSFFDHSNEQRQISPEREEESETENELEILAKELVNVRVQLEVKDSIYKQTLLKLDHHQKVSDQLSKLLKKSDHQKNFYINEFQEANARTEELESSMNMMANKLSESEKLQEQITVLSTELALTQGKLVNMEREFSSLRQEKDYFVAESEVLRSDLSEEKRKKRELTRDVSQLNEQILGLETKVDDIKQEKEDALLEKKAELDSKEKASAEAEEKLEKALKDLDVLREVENQLVEKSAHVESLEMDLKRANALQRSLENATSDAISELNKVKETMELLEQRIVDQAGHIDLLEAELKQLKTELENTKEEQGRLGEQAEAVKAELESSKEKENDAQVEIAMLKFELHKARSKLAALEANEARGQSEKSVLFNALQEMGLEIEETKKENQVLREEEVKMATQSKNDTTLVEESKDPEAKPAEECGMLIKNVDVVDTLLAGTSNQSVRELKNVRKELETAISKIGEFWNRAEQAISRAEAAEKAKVALELQMKKMKEHKERRKATLSTLYEESVSKEFGNSSSIRNHDHSAKNYQPLGKVLNMKF